MIYYFLLFIFNFIFRYEEKKRKKKKRYRKSKIEKDMNKKILPGDETTFHKFLVLNQVVHDLGMKERRNLFRLMREEGLLLNAVDNDDDAIHMFFTNYGMTVGEFSTLHLLNGKETVLGANLPIAAMPKKK
jgi:hypothetical protein